MKLFEFSPILGGAYSVVEQLPRLYLGAYHTGSGTARIYRSSPVFSPSGVIEWEQVYSEERPFQWRFRDGATLGSAIVFWSFGDAFADADGAYPRITLLHSSNSGSSWNTYRFGRIWDAGPDRGPFLTVADGALYIATYLTGSETPSTSTPHQGWVYRTTNLSDFTAHGPMVVQSIPPRSLIGFHVYSTITDKKVFAGQIIDGDHAPFPSFPDSLYEDNNGVSWIDRGGLPNNYSGVRTWHASESAFNTIFVTAPPDAPWAAAGDSLYRWNRTTNQWTDVWPGFWNPGGNNPTGSITTLTRLAPWPSQGLLLISQTWDEVTPGGSSSTDPIRAYDNVSAPPPTIWVGQYTGRFQQSVLVGDDIYFTTLDLDTNTLRVYRGVSPSEAPILLGEFTGMLESFAPLVYGKQLATRTVIF